MLTQLTLRTCRPTRPGYLIPIFSPVELAAHTKPHHYNHTIVQEPQGRTLARFRSFRRVRGPGQVEQKKAPHEARLSSHNRLTQILIQFPYGTTPVALQLSSSCTSSPPLAGANTSEPISTICKSPFTRQLIPWVPFPAKVLSGSIRTVALRQT